MIQLLRRSLLLLVLLLPYFSQVKAADDISPTMAIARVGGPAPAFDVEALLPNGKFGRITLEDSVKAGKFTLLLFYPLDWTFVCPTEIIAFSDAAAEFEALNTQVLGVSIDSKYSHLAWTKQHREAGGLGGIKIPLLSDIKKEMATSYGVLHETDGVAYRGLFIIDPKGIIRQITINDLPIGRDVSEAQRLLKAIQFHQKHGEVCPVNWKEGDLTMKDDPDASLEYFTKVNRKK